MSGKHNKEGRLGRAYGWFLERPPVPLVLAVMWLAGAALIGLGGVAFYLLWLLLWRVAGAGASHRRATSEAQLPGTRTLGLRVDKQRLREM